MQRILKCGWIILSGLAAAPAGAEAHSAESRRVERLAALGRLWGTVKYAHPYLAYRPIDWDKALVESIPRMNRAETASDFAAAVNHMLSFLKDPNTRAEIAAVSAPGAADPGGKLDVETVVKAVDGVVRVDVDLGGRILSGDNSKFRDVTQRVTRALEGCRAVVLDLRGRDSAPGSELGAFWKERFLMRILPQMVSGDFPCCSSRWRLHNGFASQAPGAATFYYSGFTTEAPPMLRGERKAGSLPIAFIINDRSTIPLAAAGGLQAAGKAAVIQDGAPGMEPGVQESAIALPEGVKVRVRTTEMVYPDGSVGFRPDKVVSGEDAAMREAVRAVRNGGSASQRKPAPAVQPMSTQDRPYSEMEFPDSEYRLLSLFRFWNVIHYFFPYKHLQDEPWDNVLRRHIERFEACRNALDYQRAAAELAAEVKDTHVGVRGADRLEEATGTYVPGVMVKWIENRPVVTAVMDESTGLKVGDVIETLDGEFIRGRLDSLKRRLAASTEQSLQGRVHQMLLLGAKDSRVKVGVVGESGVRREVEAARSISVMDPRFMQFRERGGPVVKILPSGYGYVDLDRLQVGEVDSMFESIKGTPAVIFDMRGYPNGTAWAIAPRLTEKQNVTAALFSRPIHEGPAMANGNGLEGTSYAFEQKFDGRKEGVYKGRVVMLINDDAISQSEHTCLYFEAATDVTFIGTPTTGANGDVTLMVLPGNLTVSFTGHNVRHGDGRQLQRVGIQPHIRAAPTIAGIRAGRDEILEAAVDFLQSKSAGR